MNWDAIGAIGEVVGAFAVVVTLAYLASQVRYAKAAANDANRLTRASGVCEMLLTVATDNELRDAVNSFGVSEPYLSDYAEEFKVTHQDAARSDIHNLYYFWLHWGQFASSKSSSDLEEIRNIVSAFYRTPQVLYSWENSPWARPMLDPKFVAFVDAVLSESQGATGRST